MKQYLLVSVMVLGLTACGSSGGGNSNGSGALTPSSVFTDVATSSSEFRIGHLNIEGANLASAFQYGNVLMATNDDNQILVDINTGKTAFYEITDSDYPEVAKKGSHINEGTGSSETLGGNGTFEFNPPTGLTGSIQFENEPSSNFIFTVSDFSALAPSSNSLSVLSNTYTVNIGPVSDTTVLSITVDSAGLVTGQSDQGCTLNGTAELPDSNYNGYLFNINLSGSGCDEAGQSGDYSGMGYLGGTSPNFELILRLYGDKFAFRLDMAS